MGNIRINVYEVNMAIPSRTRNIELKLMLSVLVSFALAGCGSSSSSSTNDCDIVANSAGPAFFKVENSLSTGLSWHLPAFAFGADMKPGECTIMGVNSSQFTAELQQCNIGSGACTSTFGPTKLIVFSVLVGEAYTLIVTSSTFN